MRSPCPGRWARLLSALLGLSASVVGNAAGHHAENARDLPAVLAFYSDSALLLPPHEPPVRGHAAIQPRYERLFTEFDPAIEGHADRIILSEAWAYVRGRNLGRLRARRAGSADRRLNDSYTMLLHEERAGEWRIAELSWHAMTAP